MNVAVFFIIAVLGLEVFGVILAGYSSASKWSLFGAMREAAQVVSYEVPLGMCAVVPVLLAGSMDLVFIGDRQAGWFWNWYIFHDPFTFITFWVYFTCATASVNRAPFDLAEAESELVAGFHTEYSGLRWSFFFMAEYGSMLAVSLLASILFLGGWHGPLPIAQLARPDVRQRLLARLSPATCWARSTSLFKGVVGVTVMMWVRWTLPRLRIDQVITTCLKYCVPIAAVAFLGATLVAIHAAESDVLRCSSTCAGRLCSSPSCWPDNNDRQLTSPPNDSRAGRRRKPQPRSSARNGIAAAMEPIYWPSFFFLLFAAIACAFAIAVVVSPNIVRMAFYLVMSLAATAGLFFLAGADFVGSMQILIYVGGTLVLLVFGVMLTSQDRFISMKTSRVELGMAAVVGACLFVLLVCAACSVPEWRGLSREQVAAIAARANRDADRHGPARRARRCDRSPDAPGYLLIFEIISVHCWWC